MVFAATPVALATSLMLKIRATDSPPLEPRGTIDLPATGRGTTTRPTSICPMRPVSASPVACSSTRPGSAAHPDCCCASTAPNGLSISSGEVFDVTDAVGAELLEISRDNFRQRLTRARRDLHNFMNDKCGLVDPGNPCRCEKKTRGFIQAGYVDPANLLFARARVRRVREVVPEAYAALAALDAQCARIFRDHPFYDAPDIVPALRSLIATDQFRRATDLP